MSTKSQHRGAEVGMFITTTQQYFFSLARKLDSELALRMSFGSEFQTFGAATQNARFGCLSACPRHRETRSVGGPQRPRRHLALYEFVDVRLDRSSLSVTLTQIFECCVHGKRQLR